MTSKMKNTLISLFKERLFNDPYDCNFLRLERGMFVLDPSSIPFLSIVGNKKTLIYPHQQINIDSFTKKIRYELRQVQNQTEVRNVCVEFGSEVSAPVLKFLYDFAKKSKINRNRIKKFSTEGRLKSFEFKIDGELSSVFVWYISSDKNYARLIYNVNNNQKLRGKYAGLIKYGYFYCIRELLDNQNCVIDLGGIPNQNTGVDKTKKIFSTKSVNYYNYWALRIFGF